MKLTAAAGRERGRPGFTLPELVIAGAIMATILMTAVPILNTAMHNSKLDGAARQMLSDLREARSRAITTGWRFRVVAHDGTQSGTYRNQYRIEGKSSGGCDNTGWPAETMGVVTNSSVIWVGPWVNLNTLYPDITLAPLTGSGTVAVCFDGKGIATFSGSSHGLQVNNRSGVARSVQVSTAGSVQIL